MSDIANALRDLKEDEVKKLVDQRLAAGDTPVSLLAELN